MKILKRILAVCSFCTLLTATNCFAVTLNKTDVTDNKLNCYRTYLVQSGEQNSFIENIDKEIEVFGDKYTYDSYEVTGGSTLDTIEINTTKKITSKTKNLDSIINQLETTISYDENDTGGASQYIKANNQVDVDTVTIEDIIDKYNIKPHILKIDCEGCEVNIVKYSDLSMFHQIIMEYHTNVTGVNEDILIDILKNQGFELKSQVKFKNKGMGIVYMINKMDAKNF